MFTNSIAIESTSKPAPTDRTNVTESTTSKKDFTTMSDVQLHTGSILDNGHIQNPPMNETVESQQQQMVRLSSPSPPTFEILFKQFSQLFQFRLQNTITSPHDDQMEQAKMLIGSSNTSPVPEFLSNQLIEDSIGLSRNCDNDLLFQQLPLPEQLLQSDEKDGEDDSSNSMNGGAHKHEQNRDNFDLTGSTADNQEQQDQTKVNSHPKYIC